VGSEMCKRDRADAENQRNIGHPQEQRFQPGLTSFVAASICDDWVHVGGPGEDDTKPILSSDRMKGSSDATLIVSGPSRSAT